MFVELLSCWAAMELEAVGALLKNEYLFPIFRKGDSGGAFFFLSNFTPSWYNVNIHSYVDIY